MLHTLKWHVWEIGPNTLTLGQITVTHQAPPTEGGEKKRKNRSQHCLCGIVLSSLKINSSRAWFLRGWNWFRRWRDFGCRIVIVPCPTAIGIRMSQQALFGGSTTIQEGWFGRDSRREFASGIRGGNNTPFATTHCSTVPTQQLLGCSRTHQGIQCALNGSQDIRRQVFLVGAFGCGH